MVLNLHREIYNYQNLDEIDEFKGKITSTEFLAEDICNKILNRLRNEFSEDYKSLKKIKEPAVPRAPGRLPIHRLALKVGTFL